MQKNQNVVFVLLILIIIENSANNAYRDLSKYPQNPSYFIEMLRSPDVIKHQFALNNTGIKGDHSDMSVTPHVKKQNVNRVSQKQYEVINMLWRKTKIFVDIEASTATYLSKHKTTPRKPYSTEQKHPFQISLPRLLPQISTPSYIEFYYIHEVDDRVKEKKSPNFNIDIRIAAKSRVKDNNKIIPNKTLYGFQNHNKQNAITPHPQSIHNNIKTKKNNKFIYYVDFFTHKISTMLNKSKSNITKVKYNKNEVTSLDTLLGNETCPSTTLQDDELQPEDKNVLVNSTDENDAPFNIYNLPNENKVSYEKISLQHMDQNTGHENIPKNKAKHSKKHIDILLQAETINDLQVNYIKKEPKLSTKCIINRNFNKSYNSSLSYALNAEFSNHKTAYNYVNSSASWSEYRFVAVYVYEPLQVHCDAAGISPHWLVTAGSCLARHHKNPGGEGLSAYVTYCGDNWWNPERISYVKYSLVHPRYHPRNRIRRHLYNIAENGKPADASLDGIIQVVNSMVSVCPGWSPVSLMSHHFSANIGPRATAIGWGLDRYDARYTVTDLPKRPLMMYDARVYSDSCPGNIGYNKAKQLEDEGGVRNLYCLSLPPYNGEENDPVHGSLLLVGEKLIALYLQEERRPWGEQSAMYTGTWRLVPWVLDHARESEDSDIFTVDI